MEQTTEFIHVFSTVRITPSLVSRVIFCWPLFVSSSLWSLYCLSFDLQIPLTSENSKPNLGISMCVHVAAIKKNSKTIWWISRYVAAREHSIPILRQPAFTFTPYCSVLGGETTHTNCIVFGLTRLGHKPTIYNTRYENAIVMPLMLRYGLLKLVLNTHNLSKENHVLISS